MAREDLRVRIGGDIGGLNSALGKAGRQVGSWARSTTRRLRNVGLAFAGILTGITTLGVKFEKEMKFVGAITNATQQEFIALTDVAREMGRTTEYTSYEAAQGLRFLGMAGFEATQAVKALPGVLNLATAGMIELWEASDIATNILTQMGLEVEQLTMVNDALAKVQTTSNTNIRQAAEAFVYGGTMAKQFGMQTQELAAMIGLLANRGIRGSLAGTTLRQAMIKLLNPSKEAGEALKQYGIYIHDATGKLRNFTDIILDMADAKISAEDAARILGARASQLASIFQMSTDEIMEYINQIYQSEGANNTLAESVRNTLWGAFKELWSSMQDVGLTIFDTYKEDLKIIINRVTDMTRAVGAWIAQNKELIKTKITEYVQKFMGAVSATVKWLGQHGNMIETGLIGYVLFGKKGAIAFAAYQSVIDKVLKLMYGADDAVSRHRERIGELVAEKKHLAAVVERVRRVGGDWQKVLEDQQPRLKRINAEIITNQNSLKTFANTQSDVNKETKTFNELLDEEIKKREAIQRMKDYYTSYSGSVVEQGGGTFTRDPGGTEKKEAKGINVKEFTNDIDRLLAAETRKAEQVGQIAMAEQELKESLWDEEKNRLKEQQDLHKKVAENMSNRFASAFRQVIDGSKSLKEAFGDMAKSIIKDITMMIAKKMMMVAVNLMLKATGIGSLISIGHQGGLVGHMPSKFKMVPPQTFKNAPRLHEGLNPDEFPAILQKGERVIPRGGSLNPQRGGGGRPNVNIIMENPVFQDLETQQQHMRAIATEVSAEMAPNAVISSYENDERIRNVIRNAN